MGFPTIYPTGVTLYDSDQASNGYTIFPSAKGTLLIDMNGNEVHRWAGLSGEPNKLLPGGSVLGSTASRNPRYGKFSNTDLVQISWNGDVEWLYNRFDWLTDPGEIPHHSARQNHDFQREGSATGYYAPDAPPRTNLGNTLILVGEDVYSPHISPQPLLDSTIIEVTWEGEIVWRWRASDHFDELGFNEGAKDTLYRHPSDGDISGEEGFWLGIDNFNTLGPNRWYDNGDERFKPDNIIWSSRNANIIGIIDRTTGNIVWKLGPDYNENPATRSLGWIIGPHHAHIIPRGLPGEGNLLLFDNGGCAGYGSPSGSAQDGIGVDRRDYSRVLELNPRTLGIIWQYTPNEAGFVEPLDSYKLFSPLFGSAQRLPNGNTLITEGQDGRLFEVTVDHEIVWEYINPYFSARVNEGTANSIYRAYRVPYEWVPQLVHPIPTSVKSPNVTDFRVPGSPNGASTGKITTVQGVDPFRLKAVRDPHAKPPAGEGDERDFCVVPIIRATH